MHIISAALCAALCCAAGFLRAYTIETRKKAVCALLHDITVLSEKIDYTAEPVSQILSRMRPSSETAGFWKDFSRELEKGRSCGAAWESAFSCCELLQTALNDDERAETDSFFRALGTGESSAEKKRAEHLCAVLEKTCERLEKDTQNRKKLCKSLGALSGLGLAILIL